MSLEAFQSLVAKDRGINDISVSCWYSSAMRQCSSHSPCGAFEPFWFADVSEFAGNRALG